MVDARPTLLDQGRWQARPNPRLSIRGSGTASPTSRRDRRAANDGEPLAKPTTRSPCGGQPLRSIFTNRLTEREVADWLKLELTQARAWLEACRRRGAGRNQKDAPGAALVRRGGRSKCASTRRALRGTRGHFAWVPRRPAGSSVLQAPENALGCGGLSRYA